MPRYKTYGGGIIGPSSANALPPGFELPFRDRVRSHLLAQRPLLPHAPLPKQMLFGLINRPEFDQRLVEHAQKAGAELRTGVTVQRVERRSSAVPDRRTVAIVLRGRGDAAGRGRRGRRQRQPDRGHVGVKLDQVDSLGLEAEIPVRRPSPRTGRAGS